jgi:hypothetical protein
VISRKVLWSIAIGVVAVLIMTWRVGRFPARVVLINQSGTTLTHVVLNTDDGPADLGSLRNAETKRISINPSNTLTLAYNDRTWRSPDGLTAGQSLVIYVRPDLRVTARSRIGTLSR